MVNLSLERGNVRGLRGNVGGEGGVVGNRGCDVGGEGGVGVIEGCDGGIPLGDGGSQIAVFDLCLFLLLALLGQFGL